MNKTELRKQLKTIRDNMTQDEVEKKSSIICEKVLSLCRFKAAETVMIYLPLPKEVNTKKIAEQAFFDNKNLLVPVTETDIKPCLLTGFDDLKKGKFGISEPKTKIYWNKDIDICIVPGLGFEKSGKRLGFGGGYYDRFLADIKSLKVGIAFSNQIVKDVFSLSHDVAMDIIITEEGTFYCENFQ